MTEGNAARETRKGLIRAAGAAAITGSEEQLRTAIRVQTAQLEREELTELVFELLVLLSGAFEQTLAAGHISGQ